MMTNFGEKFEFPGSVFSFDPKLIGETDFDSFFLALGLIYGDLKSSLTFLSYIVDYTKAEESEKISFHSGEVFAQKQYIFRSQAGLINELFKFIEENRHIYASKDFQILLCKLSRDERGVWNDLLNMSAGTETSKLKGMIHKIRNHIIFHYKDAPKNLKKGYRHHFFVQEPTIYNKGACIGVGRNMRETRFFYCEAAMVGHMINLSADNNSSAQTFGDRQSEFVDFLRDVVVPCISVMMLHYLSSKGVRVPESF
jgi:hypothetical protein